MMIFRRSWLVLLLVLHLSFTIKEEKMETMATLNSGEDFIDDLHFFPPFALGGKIKLVKPCSCYECWYWQLPDGSRRSYRDCVDLYAIAYDDYISAEELINFRCPECKKVAIAT